MITSPSRNGLVTIFVHPHNADVPVKVVNISTAPTAGVIQEMKDLQTEEIFDGRNAVDVYKLRSIKPSPRAMRAVFGGCYARRSSYAHSRSAGFDRDLSKPLKTFYGRREAYRRPEGLTS